MGSAIAEAQRKVKEQVVIPAGYTLKWTGDFENQQRASGWERIAQERFDLLVMDIMMPKVSGLDLCRRFRQYYGYAVPVLILIALGGTEDIVRGLEAGADDYLVKPFSFAELNARIKALLR